MILGQVYAARYGITIAGLFGGMILLTYGICVAQGECEAWLPMISDTWVHPPENYISRWGVGVMTDSFAVLQLVVFWINEMSGCRSTLCGCLSHKTLLYMSWIGIFFLSWVGAICEDDTDPQCLGNNTIHTTCAVLFFIFYDIYMLVLSGILTPTGHSTTRLVLALLSVLSKTRWLVSSTSHLDGVGKASFIALFEWGNVGFIIIWTAHYILTAPQTASLRLGLVYEGSDAASLRLGLVYEGSDAREGRVRRKARGGGWGETDAGDGVLTSLGCRTLAVTCAVLYLSTLVVSYVVGRANGTFPSGSVPFISDMWVSPPGNYFSRWGAVHGMHAGVWVQTCLYFITDRSKMSTVMWLVSVVALLGLSMVGCVNEDENIVLHGIGAVAFFGGYDLYMLYSTFFASSSSLPAAGAGAPMYGGGVSVVGRVQAPRPHRVLKACLLLLILGCQFCVYVVPRVGLESTQPFQAIASIHDIEAILEWSDALLIIGFLAVDVFTDPATSDYALAVLRAPATTSRFSPSFSFDHGSDPLLAKRLLSEEV